MGKGAARWDRMGRAREGRPIKGAGSTRRGLVEVVAAPKQPIAGGRGPAAAAGGRRGRSPASRTVDACRDARTDEDEQKIETEEHQSRGLGGLGGPIQVVQEAQVGKQARRKQVLRQHLRPRLRGGAAAATSGRRRCPDRDLFACTAVAYVPLHPRRSPRPGQRARLGTPVGPGRSRARAHWRAALAP